MASTTQQFSASIGRGSSITIGLAIILFGSVIVWATNDAGYKSAMSQAVRTMQEDVAEIKDDVKDSNQRLGALEVRVALIEAEMGTAHKE